MSDQKQAEHSQLQANGADGQRDDKPCADVVPVRLELGPFVEPGTYHLTFLHYRTKVLFGNAPKLELRFRIIDFGEYFGTQVSRWYNVRQIKGPPRKSGNFLPGRHSDFLREYLTLFPVQVRRLDRISFKPYRNTVIKGRIGKVKQNSAQKQLPEALQYSVVKELVEAGK